MPQAQPHGTVASMLPPTLFSLPADTEVIAPGEVLRRRNEVLTTVLHLESGRVLRGVLDDGFLRHQRAWAHPAGPDREVNRCCIKA